MEFQSILHVWINHDNVLVDLTLTSATPSKQHGKAATKTSETIHIDKKHPFLTKEKGFLTVGQITLGMHVLRADGTYGVVTGLEDSAWRRDNVESEGSARSHFYGGHWRVGGA